MDGGGYPRYVACSVVAAAAVCVSRRLILLPPTATARSVGSSSKRPSAWCTRGASADGVTTVFVDAGPAFVHTAGSAVQRGPGACR